MIEEDTRKIQQQFNKVIAYSQDLMKVNTDDLFSQWKNAKRDLFKIFGGKLIWEYPEEVTFTLDADKQSQYAQEFIDWVYDTYKNDELYEFLKDQKTSFFDNKVTTPAKDKKVPIGMKISRAFKYFEDDAKIIDTMQTKMSMILQKNKIRGTLCLSIHPLDYLSISENTHNWRSCHALDGEYRAGDLSYMVDSATFVCYLKTSDNETLPNFPSDVPWNSKKWRVLLYLSNDKQMMFAGKQYPFHSDEALNFLSREVLPRVSYWTWNDFTDKKIRYWKFPQDYSDNGTRLHNGGYVGIGNRLINIQDLVKNVDGSMQFNDVLSSSSYDPMYSYRLSNNSWTSNDTRFYIGGYTPCVCCGNAQVMQSDTMLCDSCYDDYGDYDRYYCDLCGSSYSEDEIIYLPTEDIYVCPECYDSDVMYCESCGDDYLSEHMIYDRESGEYFCQNCYEELLRQRKEAKSNDY